MNQINFDTRPILVFWESTRACLLACKHCRAEAMADPAPGEMSREEGLQFIDRLRDFGRPYPVLIMTGGDVLMRPDAFELAEYATKLGIPVGMAPSVTPKLTDDNIKRIHAIGVKIVSISLDGSSPETHDGIRGIPGHFVQTVAALKRLVDNGITVQVNTVVMRDNVDDLPAIVQILRDIGVKIWEVFFLVSVGRGKAVQELTPAECEDVAHFLFESSTYDITVRTVEAPFFRRVILARRALHGTGAILQDAIATRYHLGPLYKKIANELEERMGLPISEPRSQTSGTRDGKGIIFVAHDGSVYPAGFLPIALGNIRETELATIYREHPILHALRAAHFPGQCGACVYHDSCGGSRSRAFSAFGDPFGDDPACILTGMSGYGA